VDDARRNIGVGTRLFEHPVTLARDSGIGRLPAGILPGNRHMLDILLHSGLPPESNTQDAVLHVEFRLAGPDFSRHCPG